MEESLMSRAKKPEKIAERKFVKLVERKYGGQAIKLQTAGPYGTTGRNDRFVCAPGRVTVVIEFKREGEEPTNIQKFRHKQFRRMGFPVHVAYSCDEAEWYLQAATKAQAVSTRLRKVRR
jgi:hypothetical protein